MEVTEGGVRVEVEDARDGASEGRADAVFYNPEMELNRDITVAALRAYAEREPRVETYLDAMAASGVRGTRAAAEGYDVTCADVDDDAVALAARNLDPYGGTALQRDANALLHEGYFDVVDVDPYGSPMPFADAAVAGTRNLLCVTATDTAPLCGAHFESGVRRYDTVPRNTEYHPEMGLRVLIGALVRRAAARDKAAVPVCSHVSRHYARTYLELDANATEANATLESLGFVHHCQDCLERDHESGRIPDAPDACQYCGSSRVVTAGPIWLGPVADAAFAERVEREVTDDMGEADRARDLLATVARELDTPTHYDQHRLCKLWGRPAVGMEEFVATLREAGFAASRAHYSGTAFKSDASVAEMREATADLA
ncbi:tRNA (guanine(26)-N(2))-dimethyltransferase [Halobaculum sp. CBA1158]|uniref:tRNA (guanine(26)-N(2))-dimethyltransferase n=1 Tax=Halobaculum sp. CBA1158 TaxID=2904243 RepID=UPI001F24F04F|nr:tRNA (guanine(26)-N(2))-dimethyltransferase [Halobaculum sp. CBA1158]UIP00171.1 tRNA (guanine(26)-N(2))-dimethyltransferase [Halobaculum sp. CBA1158]